jgi:hypothetical protein
MSDYYDDLEMEDMEEIYEEEIDYIKMLNNVDEMLENIYEAVIVPYLDNICQSEILDKLDEFTVDTFKTFFKENSSYYLWLLNKIE